jgi:hypothetical protein
MPILVDQFRPAIWRAFESIYGLVGYAHQAQSAIHPPYIADLLPELLPAKKRPRSKKAKPLPDPLVVLVETTAGKLLGDFISAYVGLKPLADQAILDQFIAAHPQTIQVPGLRAAACPVALVCEYALAVLQILKVTFGEDRLDFGQGVLQDTDRRRLLANWPFLRVRLQRVQLPDQDLLRVALEQNLALAAVREAAEKPATPPAPSDHGSEQAKEPTSPPGKVGDKKVGDDLPAVELQGEGKPALLYIGGGAIKKDALRTEQYAVVKKLTEAWPKGLTGAKLSAGTYGDAVNIFKRLRESDPDWEKVLLPSGKQERRGYRICGRAALRSRFKNAILAV